MMNRLQHRMDTEGVWDQTAYNEEMWYAWNSGSGPTDVPRDISSRVMNYLCHMNTKARRPLFSFVQSGRV